MSVQPPIESSSLAAKGERDLLLAIAVELRLHSMLLSHGLAEELDLQELRNEIAAQAGLTATDV